MPPYIIAANLDQPHHFRQSKQMLWTTVALRAPDQLRQRAAWALAQVVTMGEAGLGKQEYTSSWTGWYDIFVRHAFGNYRDVLREVTPRAR